MTKRLFMIITLTLASAGFGAIGADSWKVDSCSRRIPLRTEGDSGVAVFFIDFNDVQRQIGETADAASFQLVTDDGRAVPYSLDVQYGAETPATSYRYGYWKPAGDIFPVQERKLRRVGYLSFEKARGNTSQWLYFNVSANENALVAKPSPDIRPWWMDLATDVAFQRERSLRESTARERWRIVKDGASKATITHSRGAVATSVAEAVRFDDRLAGRRVVLYLRLAASQPVANVFYLNAPNAHPGHRSAIAWWTPKIGPGAYEMSISGDVAGSCKPDSRRDYVALYMDGPCEIEELHVQSPPDTFEFNDCFSIDSDIFYTEDSINLSCVCPAKTVFVKRTSPVNSKDGEDVVIGAEKMVEIKSLFVTAALGKVAGGDPIVKTRRSFSDSGRWASRISLKAIPAGNYSITLAGRTGSPDAPVLFQKVMPIRIINPPFKTRTK